ncbi:MAG: 16S rRNA (uracil(1498)-N(3))-methyltransferase [Chitinophagales bacterium]|nr:16S rRNA (uracil(1498)-N(3))-methyltransferase [Chitinophagales bacterium]
MQYFYFQTIESTGSIMLDAEESRHCLRVLRMRVGDRVEIVDGKGNLYHAEIISDKDKLCELRVHEHKKHFGKRDFKISIGIALPKNIDRFEWFLEKATEIGVDALYPMITEHSERTKLNTDRLRKILVSAMKQSGKAYLPALHEPRKFQDMLLTGLMTDLQKFIAVCEDHHPHLKAVCEMKKDALVLIGPEGDFSKDELKQAEANGFKAISLGKSRLRVETAGIVACHVVNLVNE